MSGDDLQREFIKMALSDDKEALPKALSPTFLSASQRAVHGGFGGSSLSSMNQHSIDFIAEFINAIGDEGQSEPNMYLWIRTLITRASLIGLFGRDNPLENNLNLESDLW
jgi:hypothetical protein